MDWMVGGAKDFSCIQNVQTGFGTKKMVLLCSAQQKPEVS
jgi:hypothetical protein